MMKKLIVFGIIILMVFGLSGCISIIEDDEISAIDYEEILINFGFEKYTDMYIWEVGNESITFNTMSGLDGLLYESFSWTNDTIWAYYPNTGVGYIDSPLLVDMCEYDLISNTYISTQSCSEYDLEVLTYMYRGLDRVLVDFEITLEEFNILIENVLNQD